MPSNRPGWGAFLPRYNIPETFGAAISYEAQLHWFLENWNEVAEYANALEQPTIKAGNVTLIDSNDARAEVSNSGTDINAVFDFELPKVYTRFADPAEWTQDREYPVLTVVLDGSGNSYTSRVDVPSGVPLNDPRYWVQTGNFDSTLNSVALAVHYLQANTPRMYQTVAALVADRVNLITGMLACTLGHDSVDDGGGAVYLISSGGNLDLGDFVISDSLRAHIVYCSDWYCPVMFGARDGEDCSAIVGEMMARGMRIDGKGHTYTILNQVTPPADSLTMRDCVFDFGGNCPGLFRRADDTFYAPTSVFTDSVEITGCTFTNAVDAVSKSVNSRSYSAALPLYCRKATIRDCDFHDNGCNGLILYTSLDNQDAFKDVTIDSCRAWSNGVYDTQLRKTGIGIGAYVQANNIPSSVRVVNCSAWGNANSGFAMHGIGYVQYVGCESFTNKEHGYVFQTNNGGVATGCIARNNSSRAFRIQGDWSSAAGSYCRNIVISDCVSQRGRAINIGGGVRNVLVKDCIFNVGNASRFAVNFDPMSYPDSDIVFDGNIINVDATEVTPSPRLLEGPCPVDRNVRFINTMFNGDMYDIKGYTLHQDTVPVDCELVSFKPTWPGKAYTDYTDSLTASNGTLDGHVFTSGGSAGAVRRDIQIGDGGLLAVYIEATPLTLADPEVGTGYTRLNIRTAANEYIAELALASTVQESNLTNVKGVWCNVLDLNELRAAYPTAGIVRAFFYMRHAGDVVEINEFSACLV